MQPPNFDPIARPYRWLEYLTFGPYLERCRFQFIASLADRRRALILGDGDGRFTARLLAANDRIEAMAVDSSGAMLDLLKKRVASLGPAAVVRLQTRRGNALDFKIDGPPYDLVATHFFLDCLTEEEVSSLIDAVSPHLAPGAIWLVSEFVIPDRQPASFLGRPLIAALYLAFGIVAGLKVRQLPDYASALSKAGFVVEARNAYLAGILISEVWRWPSEQ
jgi:ubiquinone/menaquinone biosynthesis C-methylase UbiE